jgi:imidazolonepropionase-like amidohydrolase
MGTMCGARVLGRDGELGSLEAGKLADIALWRLDTLPHVDIFQGLPVVERGRLVTVDESQVTAAAAANHKLLKRAGVKR